MSGKSFEELKEYFKKNNTSKEELAHTLKVHTVGWNCDGKRLASGSFDKSVCMFTWKDGEIVKETMFNEHSGSVDQLSWHKNNSNLCSTASSDKTVRIWDARIKTSVATIPTKGENINIVWSPDGNSIAVGNKDDLISFIDTRIFAIQSEKQYKFEINEMAWMNNNKLFFLTNGHGHIIILDYPSLKQVHNLKAHPVTCICIEFDPTGRYFATGSADSLISLWELEELTCKRFFHRMDWPVRTLSFSYDGQMLASGSEDIFIDIGHVETGKEITNIKVDASTFAVAWHPSEYILAYTCDDKQKDNKRETGCVKIWGFPSEKNSLI